MAVCGTALGLLLYTVCLNTRMTMDQNYDYQIARYKHVPLNLHE
jgi:hypothetical protein